MNLCFYITKTFKRYILTEWLKRNLSIFHNKFLLNNGGDESVSTPYPKWLKPENIRWDLIPIGVGYWGYDSQNNHVGYFDACYWCNPNFKYTKINKDDVRLDWDREKYIFIARYEPPTNEYILK